MKANADQGSIRGFGRTLSPPNPLNVSVFHVKHCACNPQPPEGAVSFGGPDGRKPSRHPVQAPSWGEAPE